MPHRLEVPDLMTVQTIRRFTPITRDLHVKRVKPIHCTPFAPEPAMVVLDNEPDLPAYYRIIGRGRFTPRQQLHVDRAEKAIGRGKRMTVSTFPAQGAGVIRPARRGRGARS